MKDNGDQSLAPRNNYKNIDNDDNNDIYFFSICKNLITYKG